MNKTTNVLLSVEEMYRADALAIEAGVSGVALMEAAGKAVADVAKARWANDTAVVIACGPGNNGGDGFVAARHLKQAGWSVRLHCLVTLKKLTGDAAHYAKIWQDECGGEILPFDQIELKDRPLVIDAIFGAGLTRPIEGDMATLFGHINQEACGCLSVDLPSGTSGDSGAVLGVALRADCTVTFFRKKPGHLLQPGAALCGNIIVADIATPVNVLKAIKPATAENTPALWIDQLPIPGTTDHKYTRGHALIYGGDRMTGAARLAARAARRSGAGLSSIASPPESFAIYAAADPGTIIDAVDDIAAFQELLSDSRRNVVAIGPGAGISDRTKNFTIAALKSKKPVIVDADALSVFADTPQALFRYLHPECVLTPHEGEFARLFDVTGDKLTRARKAAKASNAVVLLKGADTLIARPDGFAVISCNAPPDLATAGAGDVLVGIIAGLVAQGMGSFDATCAGAWMHGECANSMGPGLIAEDLCEMLPSVIKQLRANK